VIVDFAHNAHGLEALLDVAEALVRSGSNAIRGKPSGRVWAVIGTAGDRRPEDISALGEVAVRRGAGVIVKGTKKYLRGRPLDDLVGLYLAGVAAAGGDPDATPVTETEVEGLEVALARSRPGDVIAVMCQEFRQELWAMLSAEG
jgi:UDP-N-acetylmuramyl tripeptide synthase